MKPKLVFKITIDFLMMISLLALMAYELISAYWSFVLMSVHLGFHGSMLMGVAKRIARIKKPSRIRVLVLRIAALSISAYGLHAFVQRELGSYMLLQNQFVFFNFDEPLILFFADYLAIAGLFVCIGHYAMKGITRNSKKSPNL